MLGVRFDRRGRHSSVEGLDPSSVQCRSGLTNVKVRIGFPGKFKGTGIFNFVFINSRNVPD